MYLQWIKILLTAQCWYWPPSLRWQKFWCKNSKKPGRNSHIRKFRWGRLVHWQCVSRFSCCRRFVWRNWYMNKLICSSDVAPKVASTCREGSPDVSLGPEQSGTKTGVWRHVFGTHRLKNAPTTFCFQLHTHPADTKSPSVGKVHFLTFLKPFTKTFNQQKQEYNRKFLNLPTVVELRQFPWQSPEMVKLLSISHQQISAMGPASHMARVQHSVTKSCSEGRDGILKGHWPPTVLDLLKTSFLFDLDGVGYCQTTLCVVDCWLCPGEEMPSCWCPLFHS